jgi:hypothetical protein
MIDKVLSRKDLVFVLACALLYAVVVLVVPPYVALIEPDSPTYFNLQPNRTVLYPLFLLICKKLGLDFVQVTWVQLGIFCLALVYLLSVLRRSGFPRLLLAALVAVLAANLLFSSFHRSIVTESLYFSLAVFATGLWIEYFGSGNARYLLIAGVLLGLMMGVRPVAMALVPMQIVAVLIRRPERVARWVLIVLAVLTVGIGAGGERLLYRVIHDGPPRSTAPLLLMGKAAMLIEPGMKFSGPHAEALQRVSTALYARFKLLRDALDNAPTVAVRLHFAAAYEGEAQDALFFQDELNEAAARAQVTTDELRSELGRQVILQNLWGYLKLTAFTEVGQWSVAAQHFPPTAKAITAYAAANPAIFYSDRIPEEMLHPSPWRVAWVVYPGFLIAGAATLMLALMLPVLLIWRNLWVTRAGFFLGVAVFFSAMAHIYTLFISLANVWTPRFLMAVFPQLEVIALCVLLALASWWRARTNSGSTGSPS